MQQPHPYRNGHHTTPPADGGVVLVDRPPRTERTVFPDEAAIRGLPALFYALHRFYIAGAPAGRLVTLLWLFLALAWAVGLFPGRWWGVTVALALLLAQIVAGLILQRRLYVTFTPTTVPALAAKPLTPQEKLPIHATGLMSVEGKYRHYTWLPGFYRTFATGEHALLCLVRPRTWLWAAAWLPEETGMWYAFIPADSLLELQWGKLTFGSNQADAVAVTYRLEIPPDRERRRSEIRTETLYIAFSDPHTGVRLYVDLLHHLPPEQPLAAHSSAHAARTAP